MNKFERSFVIENLIEADVPREKHHSIEFADREHLESLGVKFSDHLLYVKFNKESQFNDEPLKLSKEMEQAGFIYRELPSEESMSPSLKEKLKKAKKICQDTKVNKEFQAASFQKKR